MPKIAGIMAVLSLALAACVTTAPRLTAIGEPIPPGVNFAGRWQLQQGAAGSSAGPQEAMAAARRDRGRGRPGAEGPPVYVFLRTGSALKITQTPDGLFVSFDRSVVEEYRFREHRLVNVGPIDAERASGWLDGRYVIRTLDSEGALLEESYALDTGGDVLVRTATIDYGSKEMLSFRHAYDRVD
jgi:hypothetical protein